MLIFLHLFAYQFYEYRLAQWFKNFDLYNGAWLTFGVGFAFNVNDFKKTIVDLARWHNTHHLILWLAKRYCF
jgi:hypothetical protein